MFSRSRSFSLQKPVDREKPTGLPLPARPSKWMVVLAFAVVYISWGTTFLAIKEGVKTLPPALFSGARITLAGAVIWLYLALRGESLRLSTRDWLLALAAGILLFVGSHGLLTTAEKTVPSGVASVLIATTPLWVAILGTVGPWKEHLNVRGWCGLVLGLVGVIVLLVPKLGDADTLGSDIGPLLVLGSSASWAVGSLILSDSRRKEAPFVAVAYQMLLGGSILLGIGWTLGEGSRLSPELFTTEAIVSYFYLVAVGSLLAYLAYVWLLRHVSPTLVGTYAYVNPVVAVFVGWQLGGEPVSVWIVGGMIVILAGVALIRTGGTHH